MQLIKETDYGTPASKAEAEVRLTIDGFEVTVPAGTSVMRAAMELGVKVPKLCATDTLKAFGSCRLCLVEFFFYDLSNSIGRGLSEQPAIDKHGGSRTNAGCIPTALIVSYFLNNFIGLYVRM